MALQLISTNCYKGTQITNVHQIYEWALKKRSVYIDWKCCWGGLKPASWVISMQGRILCDMINHGQIFYAVKEEDFDE